MSKLFLYFYLQNCFYFKETTCLFLGQIVYSRFDLFLTPEYICYNLWPIFFYTLYIYQSIWIRVWLFWRLMLTLWDYCILVRFYPTRLINTLIIFKNTPDGCFYYFFGFQIFYRRVSALTVAYASWGSNFLSCIRLSWK